MPLYLGFDAGTQSLTAVLIDSTKRRIIWEDGVRYDDVLPHYGTRHGILADENPLVATAPPTMWGEALDVLMARLTTDVGAALAGLRAISGAAQQHGTVYLTSSAATRFAGWRADAPLARQLEGVFSRDRAPVWMDASTARECAEISEALGGPQRVARLTGSLPSPRFAAPQIRKFRREQPVAYEATGRIHLVSSFLASLLVQGDAPLEPGDAAGMHLMDIRARAWAPDALDATAPGLRDRLPRLVESSSCAGTLGPWWQERYHLPPARVITWTGDNPSSLIGTGAVSAESVAISLGTSDTIFARLPSLPDDVPESVTLLGAPTGDWMGMVVFRNGSLARERMRDEYRMTWADFSAALRETPAATGDAMILPWYEHEITPAVARPGVRRFGLPAEDALRNVRALVEGQMMAMARHSQWITTRPRVIHATGGGAHDREILRVIADVFDAEVRRQDVRSSAALGAALRAMHGDALADGTSIPWEEVVADFTRPAREGRIMPFAGNVGRYAGLKKRSAILEREALGN